MITDLSADLVEEILSRVPATSLKRLRSVCKQWNAVFKDKRFAKKHFAKAAKQYKLLTLKKNRVYSMSVNLHGIASPSIELSLKDSHNITSKHVFHCDGLLLCTTNEFMLVVWNPCLGETRWIIQPKTAYKKFTWFALGYQNTTSSCRSYKILKYCSHIDHNSRIVTELEIFGLSSDSWRILDGVNPECIIQSWTGVSLKGNTYWLAYTNRVFDDIVLLSFDFSTEIFRRLCLPFQDLDVNAIALSVVREEKLVLLRQTLETLKLDIWVTTNIGQTNALTWSNFLAVDLYTHNCRFPYDVNFFIDEEKKVGVCIGKSDNKNIVCIIGEEGTYKEFSFEESTNESTRRPFVFNYVPSLVHVQQG